MHSEKKSPENRPTVSAGCLLDRGGNKTLHPGQGRATKCWRLRRPAREKQTAAAAGVRGNDVLLEATKAGERQTAAAAAGVLDQSSND